MRVAAPRLVGVFCPSCHVRASTVVIETGPVLVRHEHRWSESGERKLCRAQWVVVPDEGSGRIVLRQVEGKSEADSVLRRESEAWLLKRGREVSALLERMYQAVSAPADLQAVEDVYGVRLPGLVA